MDDIDVGSVTVPFLKTEVGEVEVDDGKSAT